MYRDIIERIFMQMLICKGCKKVTSRTSLGRVGRYQKKFRNLLPRCRIEIESECAFVLFVLLYG